MNILSLIISLIVLIYSAILHEIAHGLVADKLGDPTPRLSKRLTLNPIPHIDPFMSILLPVVLFFSGSPVIFGGAKPVPVDPFNLKEGRKDIALVSLAGPLTNLILAIIGSIVIHISGFLSHSLTSEIIVGLFQIIININLSLAIFNLLPIPPLDGSQIFSLFLPAREAATYLSLGRIGMIIIFILLAFPIGGFSLQTLITNLFVFARSLLGL